MQSADLKEIARKFIYITALMKSGSSLMWLIASALQEPSGRAAPEKMSGVPTNAFLPLTADTLKWFPNGGVYKNHAPVSYHTDKLMKELGFKCIILLRHPADHLAGFYCHQRGLSKKLAGSLKHIPQDRRTSWYLATGPASHRVFDSEVPLERAFNHLISEGYLFKTLGWMVDWLEYRIPELSIVLTYEQLMSDFEGTIVRLSEFLRGEPPTDDTMAYLCHVFAAEAEKGRTQTNREKYPRGWTGKVDTYRAYFTAENVADYNRTVDAFLRSYPGAHNLLSFYPELVLTRPNEVLSGAAPS
jgi:hypothetical protein